MIPIKQPLFFSRTSHDNDRGWELRLKISRSWLRRQIGTLSCFILTSFGLFAGPALTAAPLDVDLEVGIAQRFGGKSTDKLTLKALSGDLLTLRFQTGERSQSIQASTLQLETIAQPLAESAV